MTPEFTSSCNNQTLIAWVEERKRIENDAGMMNRGDSSSSSSEGGHRSSETMLPGEVEMVEALHGSSMI